MSTDLYPEHLKVKSELIADQDRAEEVAQDRAQDVSDDITGADFDSEAVLVVDTNECPIQIDSIVQEDYGFRAYGHFAPRGSDQSAELYTSVTRFDPPEPLGLGVVTLAHDDNMQINIVTNTGWNFEDEAYGDSSNWLPPWKEDDTGPIENGTYKIKNANSRKLVEVYDSGQDAGVNVQQWEDTGSDNQKWDIESVGNGEYKLIAGHSGHALTESFASVTQGTTVVQDRWRNELDQRWEFEAVGDGYKIRNVESGKVLDVEESGTNNGDDIHVGEWTGDDNQRWTLEKPGTQVVQDGTYTIENVRWGKVAVAEDIYAETGDNIELGENNKKLHQVWRVVHLGNGEYKLVNGANKNNVLAARGDITIGAVVLQDWADEPQQRWKIKQDGDNYRITNVKLGKVIAAPAHIPYAGENGQKVQYTSWDGDDQQRWKLTEVDGSDIIYNS